MDPVSWDEMLEAALDSDVVVFGLSGPLVRQLTFDLSERVDAEGPVVVVGWVGIVIEKITAGYLARCGADVVAAVSASDLATFEHAGAALGVPTGNLMLAGLPLLGGRTVESADGPVRRVLFADQPTVPETAEDRLFVYRRLCDYARAHPDREVLLKPRHRRGEDTFHRMRHHPEDLLSGEDVPPNLRIVHAPVTPLLDEVDLLLTVSSTAALEALDRGRRAAFVLDLGVHERLGNHVFLDSGLLRTFEQLVRDDLQPADPTWLAGFYGDDERSPAIRLTDRVEELLRSGERPSRAVWESAFFRSARAHSEAVGEASGQRGSLWARRRSRYGAAAGTTIHLGDLLVPPVAARPLRRWWRDRVGAG